MPDPEYPDNEEQPQGAAKNAESEQHPSSTDKQQRHPCAEPHLPAGAERDAHPLTDKPGSAPMHPCACAQAVPPVGASESKPAKTVHKPAFSFLNQRAAVFILTGALVIAALLIALNDFPWTGSPIDWMRATMAFAEGNRLRAQLKFNDAIEKYRDAITKYPHDARFHLNLGMAYGEIGQLDNAQRALIRATHLGKNRGQAWLELSNVYLQAGLADKAKEAGQIALKLMPDSTAAQAQLAIVQAALGNNDEADKLFPRVGPSSSDPVYWSLAGQYHLKRQEFQRAEAELRQALTLSPNQPVPMHWLALSLFRQKKFDEAEEWLKKSLKLNPDSAANWHDLGLSYYLRGQYQQAEEPFRKATELSPETTLFWRDLGKALYMQGKYQDAEEPLSKVAELDPGYGPAVGLYVDTLRKQNKHTEAEQALRRYIDSGFGKSAPLWSYLGDLLAEAGRIKEARQAYENVLKLNPPPFLASYVSRRLSSQSISAPGNPSSSQAGRKTGASLAPPMVPERLRDELSAGTGDIMSDKGAGNDGSLKPDAQKPYRPQGGR